MACARVFYGVMQKGLFSAIQSFSNLVIELLDKRRLANGDFAVVQARFVDQLWTDVDELGACIQESFQFLINSRKELPVETQTASSKSQSTRTSAFVVFIALCALVYYPSVIRNLNTSIKGNRALLLLLPEDVVSSVKALKETMAALTKKLM